MNMPQSPAPEGHDDAFAPVPLEPTTAAEPANQEPQAPAEPASQEPTTAAEPANQEPTAEAEPANLSHSAATSDPHRSDAPGADGDAAGVGGDAAGSDDRPELGTEHNAHPASPTEPEPLLPPEQATARPVAPAAAAVGPSVYAQASPISATAPAAPAPSAPESSGTAPALSTPGPSAPPQSAPAAAVAARETPAAPEAPRTRWGGIIWGLVFLALAGAGFWSTTALSADFLADIWLRITPLAVGAGMVFVVGAIAVLCALVALARHLQRRSAAQRSLL